MYLTPRGEIITSVVFKCKNCGRTSGVSPSADNFHDPPKLLTLKERLSGLYGWDILGRAPGETLKFVLQCIYCGHGLMSGVFLSNHISKEFCEEVRKIKGIANGAYGETGTIMAWETHHTPFYKA